MYVSTEKMRYFVRFLIIRSSTALTLVSVTYRLTQFYEEQVLKEMTQI
jgi:hypothetical protein